MPSCDSICSLLHTQSMKKVSAAAPQVYILCRVFTSSAASAARSLVTMNKLINGK